MSDFSPFGRNMFGENIEEETQSKVARKFIVPPFTILSARDGSWQKRKKAWLKRGIKGELGRGDKLLYGDKVDSIDYYRQKEGEVVDSIESNTSVFDPVLCELAYRWFTKEGDQVVDPFAGGMVRGVVASYLNRRYWGCDLSQPQIKSNREQASLLEELSAPIVWVNGDSERELNLSPDSDFIFSCPPYGDLEQYSEDPRDLSAMSNDSFLTAYKNIIRLACDRLRMNRFACFVVGDYRCPKGFYRNFVGQTVSAFEDAGVRFYNEAILVTPVASAAMRVTQQFEASRKFAKTHQNVLVFCKGDPKLATQRISQKQIEESVAEQAQSSLTDIMK